jgi:uncharacterized protein YciI
MYNKYFPMNILYSITFSPSENYDLTKSVYQQDLLEHGHYLQRLLEEGKLLLAGPFTNHAGGQVILYADSQEEALSIVKNDPAVVNKIFSYEMNVWHIRFDKSKNAL